MEQEASVCRLCLESFDPCTMTLLNHDERLTKAIFQITSIEVIADTSRYEYLCDDCQSVLEQCMQFRATCLHNDSIFRARYVDDCSENYIMLQECIIKDESLIGEPFVELLEEKVELDDEGCPLEDSASKCILEDGKPDNAIVEKPSRNPRKSKSREKQTRKSRKSAKRAQKVQCQHCGKLFSRCYLSQHQQKHSANSRKYKCHLCPNDYSEARALKLHINASHTHEKQYTCDQCGKVFGRPATLRVHYLAAHTDVKRYECKNCGEKFRSSAMRAYHYRMVHTTGYPWQCEYCSKAFKVKSDWTIHTRIHTGEKPFKCDICNKTFNKSYNVVIHKKSHRNDKNVAVAT